MSNYSGFDCPVCSKAFTDTDDVVVCPDCGTPVHRECWVKVGGCVNAHRHAAGYDWAADHQPKQPTEVACPHCGSKNPTGAKFCNNCGAPLESSQAQANQPRYARPNRQFGAESEQPREGQPSFFSAAQIIGPEDEIGGIKSKDWASYVRRSVPYYLMRFFQMEVGGSKIAVNFGAFLFGPLYFFYRKMYKWGAAFFTVNLLFNIPTLVLFWYDTGNAALLNINVDTWLTVGTVMGYVNWGLRLAAGLFAVYLYKKDASEKIRRICASTPEGLERTIRLSAKGGTSLLLPILALVVSTALLSFLMVAFAGPQLSSVLDFYMSQMYAL